MSTRRTLRCQLKYSFSVSIDYMLSVTPAVHVNCTSVIVCPTLTGIYQSSMVAYIYKRHSSYRGRAKSSLNESMECRGSYYSQLQVLCLESLELRWIRADLISVYKIVFGQLCAASDAFFIPRAQSQLRGHPHALSKQWRSSSVMRTFFSSRVINM